jgi:hypothetical protein
MTKDTVCTTPGCWIRIKPYERYCLACQLDKGMPITRAIPRRPIGRPPGTGTPLLINGLSGRCRARNHKQCPACRCDCHQQDRGSSAA